MPCSRTQHGLTRVGLEPPTSGYGVRGINHQATALPVCTCVYMHACRVHACVMPYFSLAVNIFNFLPASDNKMCVGRLIFYVCVCVRMYMHTCVHA